MLKDFIEGQRLAFEMEAQRLWDLIPVEFGDKARSLVFEHPRYGPDYFMMWLLELIAGKRHWHGYSDIPAERSALKICGWKSLDEAEYAFDCLAFAWKDEINVSVAKEYQHTDKKSKRGTYLEVKFSIPD